MANQKAGLIGLVFLGLFAFAWVFYPTPYEVLREGSEIYRVNRFSGLREISTDKGWELQSTIRARNEAERRSKADQDEARKKAETEALAKPRYMTERKFGEKLKYTFTSRIMYIGGKMRAMLKVKPFDARLERARQDWGSLTYVAPGFLDANGFEIHARKIKLKDWTGLVDKAGTKPTCIFCQIDQPMSADEYKSIVQVTSGWNW